MPQLQAQTSFNLPQSLRSALEDTGRTRGSAATPVFSPIPNRAFQSQIDDLNMASTSFNMSPASGHRCSSFPHPSQTQGAHNRHLSSSTQRSGNSGFGQSQSQGHSQTPHIHQTSTSSHQSNASFQSPAHQRPISSQMASSVCHIHLQAFKSFTNTVVANDSQSNVCTVTSTLVRCPTVD